MTKSIVKKSDLTPWLLLPGIVLALSSVTLLTLHQAAQADPAASAKLHAGPNPAADDGGDELLEHWGDPKYAHEEQRQMAGIAGGLLMLGVVGVRRRSHGKRRCEVVPLPAEADFLKLDSRKAA